MPDKKPVRKFFLFPSFNRGKYVTRLVSSGPEGGHNALHIISKDVKRTALIILMAATVLCCGGGAIFYFLTN